MTRSCSNARAERLVDEFEEASALDRGGFSVRHGIAAVLTHIADTEGDAESLKESALETLQKLSKDGFPCNYKDDADWGIIRRALEALPE